MSRPELARIYMNFARELAERSTCQRLKVGTVITNLKLTNVLAIGYNGNAKGLPNKCDDQEAVGNCGCIHSEVNALIKAPPEPKIAFVTAAPCKMCAKALINADVVRLFYGQPFRSNEGLLLLRKRCAEVIQL